MATRLWLGHWFSTAYHFVQEVRHNADGRAFEIFGTSTNPRSVVLQACDHAGLEPEANDPHFVEFCLDYCQRHHIEVFLPGYRRLLHLAPHQAEFERLGTRLLLSADFATLSLLDDKVNSYIACQQQQLLAVPAYYPVRTLAAFREAYHQLQQQGHQICFKPRHATGGAGFRIIDEHYGHWRSLYSIAGARLSFAQAESLLATAPGEFPELLVCEYLNGAEYSIDCLAYQGQLYAAIPRRKIDGRLRYLEHNPELHAIAQRVAKAFKLSYLFNVQVRCCRQGIPKLLEINPRMPGGMYFSAATGLNLPYLAVKLALGEAITVAEPQLNQWVSEVEQVLPLMPNLGQEPI